MGLYYFSSPHEGHAVCGIVGILANRGVVAPEILERAVHSLAHRGPDDSGTVILREAVPQPLEIGLGNRRLAILDLSPLGHQPMRDSESGNWIVHNGEIYNFREIRKRLEGEGVRFVSHSDTEVLLKAYGRWGERCLAELRGMFAFAIWDAGRHRLFLARDPMGIKPLYYTAAGQYFLFASEVRTLLGTGLVPRRVNLSSLLNYLTFGSVYDPLTLIEGVSAVRAGHYLIWEPGRLRDVAYWDLVDSSAQTSKPVRQGQAIAGDLSARLEESVHLHLVSDVPIGVFLSGGIDSSSLVALLSRMGVTPSTFSIVFREAGYSEAEYSRAVARKFATDHQEILVSQYDAFDAIPGALQAMDQPTIDGLNTFLVARQTRAAGVKVALSGLGGDELFAGYSSFRLVPRMERFANWWRFVPAVARKPLASLFSLLTPDSDRNRKLAELMRAGRGLLHAYFLLRTLFTMPQCETLLNSLNEEIIAAARAPLRESLDSTRGLDLINRLSYLETRTYMLNTLLRDSDFMSMAHGLELRVPLLDHRLAGLVFSLPGACKTDPNLPKPLLLRALPVELPPDIVHRPKTGFHLPFEHWLRDQLRAQVENTLERIPSGPLASVLNPAAAQHIWEAFQHRTTSWSRPWALYVLQRWCELHL